MAPVILVTNDDGIHAQGLSALAQALDAVTEIARPHQLSVYDASYVELARRLALPLATLDQRLGAAATRIGVALFTLP